MIRTTVRRALGRTGSDLLPYGMFDVEQTLKEVSAARRLERIYHKGQSKAWNGKELLAELVKKHGGVHLAPDKAEALRNLFAVILWGELAAWKVSAKLALELEPMEAKMAATSQAHDEARHFYVMHDYLQLLDYQPGPLPPIASRTLQEVLSAPTLAQQLMGMQLMVEPIALTLFQVTREQRLEPVLCDLLVYFERDEARHVALGINHLPRLLKGLSWREAVAFWAWQLKILELEIRGMQELASCFETLGIPPRDVIRLGQAKQLLAIRMMADELGDDLPVVEIFRRIFDFRITLGYPPEGAPEDLPRRLMMALRAAVHGEEEVRTSLLTVPEA